MRPITFPATAIPYDNTNSGLASDNVQGAIDEVASNSSAAYMQVPKTLLVFMDSAFRISSDATARIFSSDNAQGFSVSNSIKVLANGTMEIEANSRGTVLGV